MGALKSWKSSSHAGLRAILHRRCGASVSSICKIYFGVFIKKQVTKRYKLIKVAFVAFEEGRTCPSIRPCGMGLSCKVAQIWAQAEVLGRPSGYKGRLSTLNRHTSERVTRSNAIAVAVSLHFGQVVAQFIAALA